MKLNKLYMLCGLISVACANDNSGTIEYSNEQYLEFEYSKTRLVKTKNINVFSPDYKFTMLELAEISQNELSKHVEEIKDYSLEGIYLVPEEVLVGGRHIKCWIWLIKWRNSKEKSLDSFEVEVLLDGYTPKLKKFK